MSCLHTKCAQLTVDTNEMTNIQLFGWTLGNSCRANEPRVGISDEARSAGISEPDYYVYRSLVQHSSRILSNWSPAGSSCPLVFSARHSPGPSAIRQRIVYGHHLYILIAVAKSSFRRYYYFLEISYVNRSKPSCVCGWRIFKSACFLFQGAERARVFT